jgi:3-dehydroquinate dehydratase-2
VEKIKIINGPNLNLLGKREPALYGDEHFNSVLDKLSASYPSKQIEFAQTNSETEMINALHQAGNNGVEAIVLNPAAFTHTSIAVADAVAAIEIPVVEVHISNLYKREKFRQRSYVSKYARGVITGFGLDGYAIAANYLFRS